MELLEVLILIVLAGLCGAVAELILGYADGGILATIIIGIIGAAFGFASAQWLGQVFSGNRNSLTPTALTIGVGDTPLDPFWSIIGSMVVIIFLMVLKSIIERLTLSRA